MVASSFLVLALASCALASPQGETVVEEELSEEQIQYYRDIFEQYDADADQRISMDENLAQDKIIAEEQGKPFDEVSCGLVPCECQARRQCTAHEIMLISRADCADDAFGGGGRRSRGCHLSVRTRTRTASCPSRS